MKIVICIFLVVATFSVYLQVKDHEFVDYDDKALISKNWKLINQTLIDDIYLPFSIWQKTNIYLTFIRQID